MSRHSKTPIEPGRRVKLTRIGNLVTVQPACPDVLRCLQGVQHVMVNDRGNGCHLESVPRRFYNVAEAIGGAGNKSTAEAPIGTTMAGLEPVVRYLLQDKGYDVQSTASAPSLPQPDLGAVRAQGVVDDGLLDLVRHHDRGIVRCGHRADPAWLIAQIALAFPNLSIVVATTRIDEAKWVARALRRWLPDDVTLVRSGHLCRNPKQVVVGNYTAILGDCLDLNRRGLVIALDAVEVLGNLGLTVLNAAVNGRMLGFLSNDRKLAPRDADHLRGYFGFEEAHIPALGHHPLPVDVIFERITSTQSVPVKADAAKLRCRAIWHSHDWNRRIARMARGLHGDDRQVLRPLQRVFRDTAGRCTERVVVLVENVEHGVALARKLPGCRLVTGPDVCVDGLTRQDQDLFMTATQLLGDNLPSIFTMATVDQIDPRQIDVLIRADAGVGLPPIKDEKLTLANGIDHRLLLIDLDDRRHHELGRWSRRRRRAYRERGWYCPGADRIVERVMDFLAARPKA